MCTVDFSDEAVILQLALFCVLIGCWFPVEGEQKSTGKGYVVNVWVSVATESLWWSIGGHKRIRSKRVGAGYSGGRHNQVTHRVDPDKSARPLAVPAPMPT
jgi:hypothetical protein